MTYWVHKRQLLCTVISSFHVKYGWLNGVLTCSIRTEWKSTLWTWLGLNKFIILCFLHPLVRSLIDWSIWVFPSRLALVIKMSHSMISYKGLQHLTYHILSNIKEYIHMLRMSICTSEFILKLMMVLHSFPLIVLRVVIDQRNFNHTSSDETSSCHLLLQDLLYQFVHSFFFCC